MSLPYYRSKPKTVNNSPLNIEISLVSVLLIMITIMLGFVIPVQLIEAYNDNPERINAVFATIQSQVSSTGQVAGASTTNYNQLVNGQIASLANNSDSLMVMGGILLIFSLAMSYYLLREVKKKD